MQCHTLLNKTDAFSLKHEKSNNVTRIGTDRNIFKNSMKSGHKNALPTIYVHFLAEILNGFEKITASK